MILADTSAWVEFLRDTGSAVSQRVDDLLDDSLATTDVVVMELLAGARDPAHLERLRRLLLRCAYLPVEAGDREVAAALGRTCRSAGETVRALDDCLVAAVALRTGDVVCHADRAFDAIARHTPLALDSVD